MAAIGVRRTRHAVVAAIVTVTMLATLLPAPAPAPATPEPTSSAIEQKKAEEKTALGELELMREALAAKVAEYVRIGRRLERTRVEMAEVKQQIAEVDADLIAKQEAALARAVEMYRGEREGLFALLLDAKSVGELFVRYKYVSIINERDTRMIQDMRLARNESDWLHQSLSDREGYLIELQEQADETREQIEADIGAQEDRAQEIGADIAEMMRQAAAAAAAAAAYQGGGSRPDGEFNPDMVISDANFRAASSMDLAQVQTFLERQTGTLATYRAADHNGEVKSIAQMVVDAAQAWNISPKVILVKLQKEQSLLSNRSPTQNAYDWAMGCGKMDSRTLPQYKGLGNQIWHGARVLDKNAAPWKPGIEMTISGSTVRPVNSSTYSLYKYTPHLRGTMSFWMIYWRHFGDPLSAAALPAPVEPTAPPETAAPAS